MTAPDPVEGLPVGARVVVRSRLAEPAGGPSLTDAVGTLVSVDTRSLVVDTRQGPVTIERSRVVAAKVVPPRPSRRGAPHLALSVEDLQRVMVEGWARRSGPAWATGSCAPPAASPVGPTRCSPSATPGCRCQMPWPGPRTGTPRAGSRPAS